MTLWELIALLSNLLVGVAMLRQHRRHMKYREAIHALLQDEGHVEGEAEAIIDEMLRMSAHLKLPAPTPQTFAYALVKQKAFRRAVAHAELHDIYLETHGRSL